MVNVDLPIALSIFLIVLVTTIVFAVNYFSNIPSLTRIQELRQRAVDFYDILFKTKGIPEDWEKGGAIPAVPGVIVYLRKVPVIVAETASIARTNEPVVVNITFDEDCVNTTWNNTVRVYDSDLNATAFNLTEQAFCSSQFLKTSNVTFNVNISANQNKKFEIYFSDDQTILASNYTVIYNTASWIPNNGDSWTEAVTDWARYAGSSGSPTLDTINKKLGTASVNITGQLDSQGLGLEYNPTTSITGVSNGWYLRAWLFIDNTANLNTINLSISDGSNVITLNVSGEMSSNSWYLFEKNISQTVWANWSSFNAASGIDFVRFFATGTAGLTRTLKIDGLRFEQPPLAIAVFPEELIEAISPSKTKGLRNVSSEEITTIGEGYKFRVEIGE